MRFELLTVAALLRLTRPSACLALLASALLPAASPAATIHFDFEDGRNQTSSTLIGDRSLDAYLSDLFGAPVDAINAEWWGYSNTFRSDAIFTANSSATLDFDPALAAASDFEILAVAFRWAVLDPTPGIDFGLDVYDDATASWIRNVFSVNLVTVPGTVGYQTLDLAALNPSWQITRLRFHDSGVYDVGLDDLTITDSRPTGPSAPEPNAALLMVMAIGAVGLRLRRTR